MNFFQRPSVGSNTVALQFYGSSGFSSAGSAGIIVGDGNLRNSYEIKIVV
jgi:hypothetical protein